MSHYIVLHLYHCKCTRVTRCCFLLFTFKILCTIIIIIAVLSLDDNDNDKDKHMSLYIHCEATEQSFTWYIKYSNSCEHFHTYTPTLQIFKSWPNPWKEASSSSYITIIRLKNRVLPDTSNVLAAIIIIKYWSQSCDGNSLLTHSYLIIPNGCQYYCHCSCYCCRYCSCHCSHHGFYRCHCNCLSPKGVVVRACNFHPQVPGSIPSSRRAHLCSWPLCLRGAD